MRTLLRKRYYCDHCNRAGGSRVHMEKHEQGCTNNPRRVCGMCRLVDSETFPIPELQRILVEEGWQALCDKVENCPACILSANRQLPAEVSASLDYEDPKLKAMGSWDFRTALKQWWDDYNENHRREGPY